VNISFFHAVKALALRVPLSRAHEIGAYSLLPVFNSIAGRTSSGSARRITARRESCTKLVPLTTTVWNVPIRVCCIFSFHLRCLIFHSIVKDGLLIRIATTKRSDNFASLPILIPTHLVCDYYCFPIWPSLAHFRSNRRPYTRRRPRGSLPHTSAHHSTNKILLSIQWEAYTLGRAPPAPEPGVDLTRAQQNALAANLELARGAGSRYLVQRWTDGTLCDKTGKGREVEVQVSSSQHTNRFKENQPVWHSSIALRR
jgi:hypothetical protein